MIGDPAAAGARRVGVVAVALLSAWSAGAQQQTSTLAERMFQAEDARASSAADMAPLFEGLASSDRKLLAQAVRALGRLERPPLVKHLLPFVAHSRPEIRATAANALGQSLAAIPRSVDEAAPLPPEVSIVMATLVGRLRTEPDPYVGGVLAETLGRLPFRSVQAVTEAEETLAAWLPVPEGAAPSPRGTEPIGRVVHPASVTGAVKGLETRIRLYQKLAPPAPATIGRLRAAATLGSDPSDADLAFIRRVAWSALTSARAVDAAIVDRGLEDSDAQVRRLAVLALGTLEMPADERSHRLGRALRDPSAIVRYDAVRVYGRTLRAAGCAPLLAAVDDRSAHVALAAVGALGDGCPAGPSPVSRLIELADTLNQGSAEWHRAAHAFVSLAKVARDHATTRMAAFAQHPVWQVRMYAARAALAMPSEPRLERLASDTNDNVREAALAGLVALRGHAADALYIDALDSSDHQLLLTAANALKGSADRRRAVPALVKAFMRLTAEQRDTSRDPRIAMLDRLEELGGKQHVGALQPCVMDFDPVVAARCAAVLSRWSGTVYPVKPAPLSPPRAGRVPVRGARIAMQRGGAFELRLFPDDAPATVARFVQLARKGYYNGLTFHRVAPNFVLQGGSPGANEYMGDGPFMRDELGLRTHARGTLGISTRGRDTGDAQIFINLADNPRLDHNYTVFAEITSGMDVVDAIVEGDVIERVDVLETTSRRSGR